MKNNTIEENLCEFTIEYTCTQLGKLVKEANEEENYFDDDLLKDLKEITFAYHYIDEVEELEVDFPLHNKKQSFLDALNKIKNSKNLIQKECYLGQVYNAYSNYCDKCGNVYDYLKRDDLKKYLLDRFLKGNFSENKSNKLNLVIDMWISTLSTFNCKNRDGVSVEFQRKLAQI